ncbi:MAG: hypothetical protein ACRDP7_17620 [Trebonia sp.]
MPDDSAGPGDGPRYETAVTRLADTLADFSQYPPEENVTGGRYSACGYPVGAHRRRFAAGSDERGTFGVHLHDGCLAHPADIPVVRATAGFVEGFTCACGPSAPGGSRCCSASAPGGTPAGTGRSPASPPREAR